jgi:hypothetical protein
MRAAMRQQKENQERRDPFGYRLYCLAEAGMEFAAELPEVLGVPLFVAIVFVFGMTWLLRLLIDAMISRG